MQGKLKSYGQTCTVEIRIHLLIFFLIVLPVTGFFFPAMMQYWLAYAVAGIGASAGFFSNTHAEFLLSHWSSFILGVIGLFLLYYAWTIINFLRGVNENTGRVDGRKLIQIPESEKGLYLKNKVQQLWKQYGLKKSGLPHIVWFVNFNLLAKAVDCKEFREIQVSSGLWERIVAKDPLAEFILLHETAHIVYRDIRVFSFLEMIISGVRKVILWTSRLGMVITILGIIYELITDVREHHHFSLIAGHLFGVPFVALLVIAPMLLGQIIIRRYGGFITSLLELRADVVAAEWLGDLQTTFLILKKSISIHRSTFLELGHSLVSLDLTHISEKERITILGSHDRLTSPKLRYFAMSVLLALLIPLNSFTPMLWAGGFDHIFIAIVILTVYLTVFTMMFSSPHEGWSFKRCLIIAFSLLVVTGLARINAYTEGYFLTTVSASCFAPNGFADKSMNLSDFQSGFSVTLDDRISQFKNIYGYWELLPEICIAALLIYFSSHLFIGKQLNKWFKIFCILILSYIVIICCYDPFRGYLYNNSFLFSGEKIFNLTEQHPGLKYLLPELVITLLGVIFFAFNRRANKKRQLCRSI